VPMAVLCYKLDSWQRNSLPSVRTFTAVSIRFQFSVLIITCNVSELSERFKGFAFWGGGGRRAAVPNELNCKMRTFRNVEGDWKKRFLLSLLDLRE
jgi:hypothetical protein